MIEERFYQQGSVTLEERLMKAADAFVAGAPQHDDMTLVVLRMT